MQQFPVRNYSDLRDACAKAVGGDTIVLYEGDYQAPDARPLGTLTAKAGSSTAPIIIRSGDDSWIDCGKAADYRWRIMPGNPETVPSMSPPPKPGPDDFAFLALDGCRHVVIEGLKIRGCWPTILYIQDSQNIVVRECDFEDATYAIFAKSSDKALKGAPGHAETSHLLIEGNNWQQDTSQTHDLWHRHDWAKAHGGECADGTLRHFNGGFLAGKNIRGNVVIRYNTISDAYNGIRLKCEEAWAGDALRGFRNANIHVVGNEFIRVRDNVTEPEEFAVDWHVRHNRLMDCHSWFSFDGVKGGYWYFYGNTGTFESRQGFSPAGAGDPASRHTIGRVLKLSYESLFHCPEAGVSVGAVESKPGTPQYPWYVFNNSWRLRCPIIGGASAILQAGQEGPDFTANLTFANNVFEFPPKPEDKGWLSTPMPPVNNADLGARAGLRFSHNLWTLWGTQDFAVNLAASGCEEVGGVRAPYPLFVNADGADFCLSARSPAKDSGLMLELEHPGGQTSELQAQQCRMINRGARQDYGLVAAPELEEAYFELLIDIGHDRDGPATLLAGMAASGSSWTVF